MDNFSSKKRFAIGSILGVCLLIIGLLYVLPYFKKNSEHTVTPSAHSIQIPLSFEKNEGQVDRSVAYLTRNLGGDTFFLPHSKL